MHTLRTPDEAFDHLPDYPFDPHFVDVADGDGGTLRVHYLDVGPAAKDNRGRQGEPGPVAHGVHRARRTLCLRRLRLRRGHLLQGQGAGVVLAALRLVLRPRPGPHPARQPLLRSLRPHVAPCRRGGGPPAGPVGGGGDVRPALGLSPGSFRRCGARSDHGDRRRLHLRHHGDGSAAVPLTPVRLAARHTPGRPAGGGGGQSGRRGCRHPGDAAQSGGRTGAGRRLRRRRQVPRAVHGRGTGGGIDRRHPECRQPVHAATGAAGHSQATPRDGRAGPPCL